MTRDPAQHVGEPGLGSTPLSSAVSIKVKAIAIVLPTRCEPTDIQFDKNIIMIGAGFGQLRMQPLSYFILQLGHDDPFIIAIQ